MENKYLLLSPLLHKDKCLRKTIVTLWMCLEERGRQYASLPRDRDLYQDPGLARLGAGHASSRAARPRMASLHNLCDRGEIILLQQIPLMGNTLKYLYLLSSDLWSKSMTFSTPVTTSTSGTEDTRPWCTDTTSEARHVTRDTCPASPSRCPNLVPGGRSFQDARVFAPCSLSHIESVLVTTKLATAIYFKSFRSANHKGRNKRESVFYFYQNHQHTFS